MNTATPARVLLLAAIFGIGATTVHATETGCVACHSNAATMQRLVPTPSVGSAEGEG